MAIVTGCIYGRPAPGGRPKQCGNTVATTVTVTKDNGGIVAMEVCLEHYQQLITRLQGTLYTENETGKPVPVRVKL